MVGFDGVVGFGLVGVVGLGLGGVVGAGFGLGGARHGIVKLAHKNKRRPGGRLYSDAELRWPYSE